MAQVIARNRNKRSKINNTEMLINVMQKRKKACLVKLQKLSDRINILEGFQNQTLGKRLNLKDYLNQKDMIIETFFVQWDITHQIIWLCLTIQKMMF
jgi:hypothetical protein